MDIQIFLLKLFVLGANLLTTFGMMLLPPLLKASLKDLS
jgi:hypothetical protein